MEAEIIGATKALELAGETPAGEALAKTGVTLVESAFLKLSGVKRDVETAESAVQATAGPTKSQWKRINAEMSAIRDWDQHVRDHNLPRYLYVMQMSDVRVAYNLARRAPAIRDMVKGDQINIVEMGVSSDITVPNILNSRIARYVAVDVSENPIMRREWSNLMNKYGIPTTNTFRVGGSATALPIASESQDLVCAYHCTPFVFSNYLPTIVKKQAVAEAARVLKPGGQLVLCPYTPEVEAAGNEWLTKHFGSVYIHTPSESDLSKINEIGQSYKHHSTDQEYLRTMVATKPL